jgi:ATP-binding cassette subfamily F protein 3
MPVLSAASLSKSFGAHDIFTGLTLSIPQGARIGLVGANGTGKTTLLRILVGQEEPSAGQVHRARGLRTGYLPQEANLDGSRTLWEECLEAFADLRAREQELSRLERLMGESEQAGDVLETYGRLQHEFEARGGYTYEQRTHQTLVGLGFTSRDEGRPLSQLSGGQRTRAYLARLLLSSPDLLLLDEPTNHLDIASMEWLEETLTAWPGAVLVVSHDRYFLDRTVKTIWEMDAGIEIYHGNYSAYLRQRAERYERRLREYRAQAEFIEKEEEYIRRNIAGQNTRQAQGRRKRLERMLEEARLSAPRQPRRLHLNLGATDRSGDLVLRTNDLSIGYADEGRALFSVPDLVLVRGECAAVIGPNGAGKTTFLRTILGEIPPLHGEVELGSSLRTGYFAQAHEGLHADWTLVEEIQAVAPAMLDGEVRDYLAKFLFTGDDAFRTVGTLSGGERGRLALACLALQGSNVLFLDEPTNHLDLPSQEALQAALSDFDGTILLVSHDRYLIDALATQIWEVLPHEGRLEVFEGSYSEYKVRSAPLPKPAARPELPLSEALRAAKAPAKALSKNERLRREQRLAAIEREIAPLEKKMAGLAHDLESPPPEAGLVARMGEEYLRLQEDLDTKMREWEELAEELSQDS